MNADLSGIKVARLCIPLSGGPDGKLGLSLVFLLGFVNGFAIGFVELQDWSFDKTSDRSGLFASREIGHGHDELVRVRAIIALDLPWLDAEVAVVFTVPARIQVDVRMIKPQFGSGAD